MNGDLLSGRLPAPTNQEYAAAAVSQYDAAVQGRAAKHELAAAVNDLKAAAAGGDAAAQFALGLCFAHGVGCAKVRNDATNKEYLDHEGSHKWIAMAASQNHLGALVKLASMRMQGKVVAKDFAVAAALLKAAAGQGHAPSQYTLAVLSEEGIRIPQDLEQARIWYSKAAANGMYTLLFVLLFYNNIKEEGKATPPKKDSLAKLRCFQQPMLQLTSVCVRAIFSLPPPQKKKKVPIWIFCLGLHCSN